MFENIQEREGRENFDRKRTKEEKELGIETASANLREVACRPPRLLALLPALERVGPFLPPIPLPPFPSPFPAPLSFLPAFPLADATAVPQASLTTPSINPPGIGSSQQIGSKQWQWDSPFLKSFFIVVFGN